MTHTAYTVPANPKSASGLRKPLPWLPLARQAIRSLQADLAARLTPAWDPALDPENMDLPELLDAVMSPAGSAALDALNASPGAQNISPEEADAITEAGGDPAATAVDGTSHPRIRLPAGKLFPLLRLAASIGSVPDRDAMLAPGAITVIDDIPGDVIDPLRKLLPDDWTLAMSMGRLSRDKPWSPIPKHDGGPLHWRGS